MSRRSRKWKRSSLDSVAEYMRTGTLTSPNEITPLQIGLMLSGVPPAPCLEKPAVSYLRVGEVSVDNPVESVEVVDDAKTPNVRKRSRRRRRRSSPGMLDRSSSELWSASPRSRAAS